jgi:hypothetical protein
MADPRATARQWLAARHAEAFNKCWHPYGDPCSACLVEAILTAPGVEVCALTTSARFSPTGTLVIGPNVEERAAILLPAEVRPAWIKEGTGT